MTAFFICKYAVNETSSSADKSLMVKYCLWYDIMADKYQAKKINWQRIERTEMNDNEIIRV